MEEDESKLNEEIAKILESKKSLNDRQEEINCQLQKIMKKKLDEKYKTELAEMAALKVQELKLKDSMAKATAASRKHLAEKREALQERGRMQGKVEMLEKELESLRQEFDSQRNEATQLRESLSRTELEMATRESSEKKISVLIQESHSKTATVAALQDQLEQAREELESIKRMGERTQLRYQQESKTMEVTELRDKMSNHSNAGRRRSDELTVERTAAADAKGDKLKESSNFEHVRVITESYDQLVDRIHAVCLAIVMFQRFALTLGELEMIQAKHKTPDQAAKTLLNILLKENVEVHMYKCFLDALKLTDHTDVYSLLMMGGTKLCGQDTTLDVAHRDVIRQHYLFLRNQMDSKNCDLVGQLWMCAVLDQSEKDDIESVKVSTRRNEKLLSVLSRKSSQHFQQFLSALDKSGQGHIREHIENRSDKTLDVAHTDIIRQHYCFLRNQMDSKYCNLVDQLWMGEVLDQSEKDDIESEMVSTRRNDKLLSVLSHKSSQQFQQFLRALDKSGQGHIREHIESRSVAVVKLPDAANEKVQEHGRHAMLVGRHTSQQTVDLDLRSSDTAEIIQLRESLRLANESIATLQADVRSLQLVLKLQHMERDDEQLCQQNVDQVFHLLDQSVKSASNLEINRTESKTSEFNCSESEECLAGLSPAVSVSDSREAWNNESNMLSPWSVPARHDFLGTNVRDRRSTVLLGLQSEVDIKNDKCWRRLLSLNRTLKDKEHTLLAIEEFLSTEPITTEQLTTFIQRHPDVMSSLLQNTQCTNQMCDAPPTLLMNRQSTQSLSFVPGRRCVIKTHRLDLF